MPTDSESFAPIVLPEQVQADGMERIQTVAIIGTVGVPASYGGFETLAENLVRFRAREPKVRTTQLSVYCSKKNYTSWPDEFLGARLHYLPLRANGVSSIVYDLASIALAISRKTNAILLLGVSGAVGLPLVRLFTRCRIVTNIDGVEWKREKWGRLARWWLQLSERTAVRFSHEVIADNQAIADYVAQRYGRHPKVIAYGGDHVFDAPPVEPNFSLPSSYALSLCRIEPENNVAMILEAFSRKEDRELVFIGNWSQSEYGRELKRQYEGCSHIHLLNPIYDAGVLRHIRQNARLYVHGHSAGGTNPSLVEIMHFGVPVIAFDCAFNRYTTEDRALYFANCEELDGRLDELPTSSDGSAMRKAMKSIAARRYTWSSVAEDYFRLLR